MWHQARKKTIVYERLSPIEHGAATNEETEMCQPGLHQNVVSRAAWKGFVGKQMVLGLAVGIAAGIVDAIHMAIWHLTGDARLSAFCPCGWWQGSYWQHPICFCSLPGRAFS
jgi:hypothetical protein